MTGHTAVVTMRKEVPMRHEIIRVWRRLKRGRVRIEMHRLDLDVLLARGAGCCTGGQVPLRQPAGMAR
jgi:hypothetical protein